MKVEVSKEILLIRELNSNLTDFIFININLFGLKAIGCISPTLS